MSDHIRDKHLIPQALSKALLELRAELTSQAEQQIISNAARKEETLNVQQIVDKQTKELKVRKTFIKSIYKAFINVNVERFMSLSSSGTYGGPH